MSVATGSVAIEIVERDGSFIAVCNEVGLRARGKTETEALQRLKAWLDARFPTLDVYLEEHRRPERAGKARFAPR